MKIEYRQALFEVYKILENTDEEIINKIPEKFMKFVKENMDTNYKFELEKGKELIKQNLKDETKQIIALIYRDYICDEKEVINDYNINFNRNKELEKEGLQKENNINNIEKSLLEIKKEKWYKKLINKILKFFKIKEG